MQAGRGAGAVRKRSRENFHSFWRKKSAHLLDAGGVGAIAVADEQSFGIEPEDVAGFSGGGRRDRAESGNVESLAERRVARAFGYAVWLAGTHHDQAVVSGER